jgi:hypothetical protein
MIFFYQRKAFQMSNTNQYGSRSSFILEGNFTQLIILEELIFFTHAN